MQKKNLDKSKEINTDGNERQIKLIFSYQLTGAVQFWGVRTLDAGFEILSNYVLIFIF